MTRRSRFSIFLVTIRRIACISGKSDSTRMNVFGPRKRGLAVRAVGIFIEGIIAILFRSVRRYGYYGSYCKLWCHYVER